MAQKEMIRIRLKAYDHQLIDQSAEKIVETAKRNGAAVSAGLVTYRSEETYFEVLAQAKGGALAAWRPNLPECKKLLTIGDYENDLSLLAAGDVCAAPGYEIQDADAQEDADGVSSLLSAMDSDDTFGDEDSERGEDE